ncbi:multicopper oxidase family protein [Corynebacterium comes]|uniref:multicopper oxidase family protein n=1 Tax=Corynebacterium comes TaxID=2675218 RepID=UPI0018CC8698|nr:multicopper oxidase family protein [Corynebacterium comes]
MSDPDRPTESSGADLRFSTTARRAVVIILSVVLLGLGWLWWDSRVPATYSLAPAAATGMAHPAQTSHTDQVDVTGLQADPDRPADVRMELKARSATLRNSNGGSFQGYTLNGSTPGPEIRARQGDMVEVVLHNIDIADGTTVHWHGVDVTAAMDGVAGVTQDAVKPGGSFTYRFVAEDPGTYWYHAHQVSHEQVIGGHFGALVIEPGSDERPTSDVTMLMHTYPGGSRTIAGTPGETRKDTAPGTTVRVRAINTDNVTTSVWVAGADPRLLAVDGRNLHEPGVVKNQRIRLAAGARADLEVTVPRDGAVRVQSPGVSLVLGPPGTGAPEAPTPAHELDLLSYGTPTAVPFDVAAPDRAYDYDIGRRIGFLDGRPGFWWTINGRMGRHVPMYMVREGEVVSMRITNRSSEVHPMHLHGHHVLVTARDGRPASGSPWWVDSLDVDAGESFDVIFLADNPGIWMDHCHNLPHAVEGLMTHISYEGVTTPFLLGRDSGNEPE